MAPSQQRLESVTRPKQARSRETLFRLLDVAEALIEEKGLADTSIPDIVARAGSSVGGFYARFKDKNELLRALEERFFQDISARVDALADDERWAGVTLGEIVEACAAELVAIARERRNLIAAFLHRATHDEQWRAEALRFRASLHQRMARTFLGRRVEMGHPDPELAVELGFQFAFGLMFQTVLVGEVRAAGRALSDAELGREIARNFLSFVTATTSPHAPGGDDR